MELKTRPVVAFLTITIVPMMLLCLMTVVLSNCQTKSSIKEYDLPRPVDFFSDSSVQIFNRLTKRSQEDIWKALDKNPGLYNDKEYLDIINAELRNHYAYPVMIREDAIIYCGDNNIMEDEALCARLPHFGAMKSKMDDNIYPNSDIYLDGENQHLIRQMNFDFPDREAGSAFIASSMDDLVPEVKSMLGGALILDAMTLVVVGIALMLWVHRSILSPLNKLQEATKKTRDGNPEFTLEVDTDDEISQLCQGFEGIHTRFRKNTGEKVQYDKDNKELISNIPHDLKTPTIAIKGYVEETMDGVAPSPERLDRYTRTIYDKVNDMGRLIDELTFYPKTNTDRIPYTLSKINVARYSKDYVDEMGLDTEARGVELGYFNYVDEDAAAIVDAKQMKRAISNIISNFVKYLNRKKGTINIWIKDVEDFVWVEIEDSGKGIAAKDTPSTFGQFCRTDSSRNSSRGGSDIGLSIVREIIEDHGGHIWTTSKEGVSTETHFVLGKYQEVIQGGQDTDRGR